jgi:hypothetical protein
VASEPSIRAAATQDLDELDAILVELRVLIRQHFAHVEEMIQECRHPEDRENKLSQGA